METAYHSVWDVEQLANTLHVLPILLPFASCVGARLVARVPVAHENGRQIIVLILFGQRPWSRWLVPGSDLVSEQLRCHRRIDAS
jgi:hypothetical protein